MVEIKQNKHYCSIFIAVLEINKNGKRQKKREKNSSDKIMIKKEQFHKVIESFHYFQF